MILIVIQMGSHFMKGLSQKDTYRYRLSNPLFIHLHECGIIRLVYEMDHQRAPEN